MLPIETAPAPLALTVNGSRLAVGTRPGLEELDPALRGIALSDSPVILRAPADDHEHFLSRLHALGRRNRLPLHQCQTTEEAEALFEGVGSGAETTADSLGTWALFGVDGWSQDEQERLRDILEALDLGRLHGRLRHEKIPRVIMVTPCETSLPGRRRSMLPVLARRISYFTLMAEPHETEQNDDSTQ